jgi:hypothetical protein
MLVDANILLFATDESSPFHRAAADWFTEQLSGARRVALPWPVLVAFLRLATNARVWRAPLSPEEAWGQVEDWLAAEVTWIPEATSRHAEVLGSLVISYQLRANQIPDAQLAALAIEHGLTIFSADTDFARFRDVEWVNPLVG